MTTPVLCFFNSVTFRGKGQSFTACIKFLLLLSLHVKKDPIPVSFRLDLGQINKKPQFNFGLKERKMKKKQDQKKGKEKEGEMRDFRVTHQAPVNRRSSFSRMVSFL